MPELNLDAPFDEQITTPTESLSEALLDEQVTTPTESLPLETLVEEPQTSLPPIPSIPSTEDPLDNSSTKGLTQEELHDPNRIEITIADGQAPVIVFFGPRSSGKTMTLVRLTRYLKSQGYSISPIRSFRPSYDGNYQKICNNFDALVNQIDAATATDYMSFMLVEVTKNGRRICQILEAPGEYYFHQDRPNDPFPAYVNSIISSSNRKVWCAFVEPDWENYSDRANYSSRIAHLKIQMRPTDKMIFILNKIDKTNFVIGPGQVNIVQARKEVNNLYPNIFAPFANPNPITRFFKPWNCQFIPFQTGTYTADASGAMTYQQGPDEYPRKLWSTIMNYI